MDTIMWYQVFIILIVIYAMTTLHGLSPTLEIVTDSINKASESIQLPVSVTVCIFVNIVSKVSDLSREVTEGSFFNSYYSEV